MPSPVTLGLAGGRAGAQRKIWSTNPISGPGREMRHSRLSTALAGLAHTVSVAAPSLLRRRR